MSTYPASKAITICAISSLRAYKGREVVLGDVAACVWFQPRLILHLVLWQIVRQERQRLIANIGVAPCERLIVETPDGTEFTKHGQGSIDEILICAREAREDDPMHVTLVGGERDIDPGS